VASSGAGTSTSETQGPIGDAQSRASPDNADSTGKNKKKRWYRF